jgi:hypothetical protein
VKFSTRLISIVLLGIFSFTFLAELSHSHIKQKTHRSSPIESTNDNSCDDVCQLGQCHFGHCSHMSLSSVAVGLITSILVGFDKSDLFNFPLSNSDQPTRPPRLS